MSLFVAIALASASTPAARPINEDQAIDLVAKALRQRYPREPLQCFTFLTEEKSRTAFDIAVYEKHNRRCGGDPQVMHVRDRFRVGRLPVRLWIDDVLGDYRLCRLARAQLPRCPKPDY